ncbi:hypothetical protein [Agromyces arachidis]|uniref:hypothetical protein n=1 Tax=Agromyces arachidis TaxID=766966 RepID=UPI004057C431
MGESSSTSPRVNAPSGTDGARRRGTGSGRLAAVSGAVALGLAVTGAVLLGVHLTRPAVDDLVVLQSVDFAVEPEGPLTEGEGWSAEVAGSQLRLRAEHPGALHPLWATSPATEAIAVGATLARPAGADAGGLYVGGITAVGADGAGWGAACGTDGNAYVLAVWDGRSQALDSVPDAGCDADPFALTLEVRRDGGTDRIEVVLPDGERVVLKPGEARGPFTAAGFVMATADREQVVPGLDVARFEVRVLEESLASAGAPERADTTERVGG